MIKMEKKRIVYASTNASQIRRQKQSRGAICFEDLCYKLEPQSSRFKFQLESTKHWKIVHLFRVYQFKVYD